ncbi:MAG: SDR family NAD(P)-dependent oxidoreductase [Candidatus Lambdaproteobacteria bacterium]|nr:SDR family NAD(P)-dependent oxidoreductase [Candidatus Lambdaproteobacteria bacterium]
MRDFAGKVAVVTGAGGGLGRALAEALAARGMSLVLADLRPGPLAETAALLAERGAEVLAQPTDVSRREPVEALAAAAYRRFGAVHLLCNNAGVSLGGGLETMTEGDWRWALGVNLWGVIHGLAAFLPRMIAGGPGGHVVNSGSMAGLIASAGLGVYTATKYAVVGLSETLARDLRPYGIGVSVLCPMGVQTGIVATSAALRPADSERRTPPEGQPELVGRWLPPAQVARLVVRGIEEERLYIVTHREGLALIERRFARLQEAFLLLPEPEAAP